MTTTNSQKPIPITVFTGFLGAGKTSIILSLLPRLSKDYKVVLLKNEFGDVEVDSQLAKQSSLTAVSEILNGCMCCVLVGQMKTALLEIREKFRPDRIIIECSGSAFPATLAFQIRELERETGHDLKLDAILTVIDAENFAGYEDNSPTARMQASYTDLIIINKWENITERALDILIDHLNTLNDLTPKIRTEGRNGVDPNLIFGLDSKLFEKESEGPLESHHDEVETVTIYKGAGTLPHGHLHDNKKHSHPHHEVTQESSSGIVEPLLENILRVALSKVSKETIWRVKGFVRTEKGVHILNWAFGRYDLTSLGQPDGLSELDVVKLTMMGERGEVKRAGRKLAEALGGSM
ncbi:cobW-domain-containing protein [Irpex rosettiformis]|uniref:CobW-domain-containing protein n=1 Tax=Irpex rosettiformis TaxID=378272 RepID=A0ACB8U7G9_9APHY|nr:cobW-domain-containing protein [Irpex rosettiformis]